MILKLLIFALCSLALLREIPASKSMGPLGHLDVQSVYVCNEPDIPEGDEMKVSIDFVKINDKGDKALDVVFENKIPINDDLNLVIEIFKFENGNWKSFHSIKGRPCQELEHYIKNLWGKFIDAFEPEINQSCPIPPGSYKLNKFQAATQDLDIKSVFYGKLMVKITVRDQDGKLLYCAAGEGDSQASM